MGHDGVEDPLDVGQGGDRDAHPVEGPGRRGPRFQLLVASPQRARERVDAAEGERREDPGEDERGAHDQQRVERKRERPVHELVAEQLDHADDERRHDDDEPADAIRHPDLATDAACRLP